MTRHSAAQQLAEAKQIAKDYGLYVLERSIAPGKTDYIVYRKLPDGHNARLGKRSTPEGVRSLVVKLTNFH